MKKDMFRNAPWGLFLGLVMLLSGCVMVPGQRAPVENAGEDVGKPVTHVEPARPGYHHVKRGDTLYGIAWEEGLDFQDLASWNHITPPAYKILEGQWMRLTTPSPAPLQEALAPARPQDRAAAVKPSAARAKPPKKIKPEPPSHPAPIHEKTQTLAPVAQPVEAKPMEPLATPAKPPKPPKHTKPAKPIMVASAEPVGKPSAGGKLGWIWPAQGRIAQGFTKGEKLRQGLDIAGQAGQPVVASESGKVVYSGSGLVGFGQIIIIKHNEEYLSAYAYNRKRLVEEGREIHKGERIAEMGQSSDGAPVLHFEIRRKGSPVDPMTYLPSR